MNKRLTLGSLFDGSGGFPLAGLLAGIEPIWASEIEPFPIRVTTKRIPQMKHYGDVSILNGARLPPVDIITFGSPCQDMSLAGRRIGLDGERSSLFYQAIRIVREMREATDGKYPRYIVWENVPGAFTSNKGRDFKSVLEAIIDIKAPGASVPAPDKGRWQYADLYLGDGWSLAYRVLDAQYYGVAQRRRRVFLVADFDSECAGEILFERQGLQRDSGTRENPQSNTAGDSEGRIGTTGESITYAAGFIPFTSMKAGNSIGFEDERSPTLRACSDTAVLMFDNHSQDSRYDGPLDIAGTIAAQYGTGGNNQPLVMEPIRQTPFSIGGFNSLAWLSDNPRAGIYKADTVRTLDASDSNPSANQGGTAIVETYAMTVGYYMQVAKDVTPPLMARDFKDPIVVNAPRYRVRRLMPMECARLQGFPSDWCTDLVTENPTEDDIAFWADVFETHRHTVTRAKTPKTKNQIIKWLRNPHTDSAEYRLWGNGVALPCVYFVLAGIAENSIRFH